MITYGEVEKLHCMRAADQSVLSVYAYVPSERASMRELQAHAMDLVKAATERAPDMLHREDELLARRTLAERAGEWLGHTLGIFVSGQLSLLEVVPLRGSFPERAVLAARPHVRPLLAALGRYPDHRVVVMDHRHAWLLTVAGDRVEIVARTSAESLPSAGFGGWYFEQSHVLQRVTEVAPHFYQDAAAILDRQARHGSSQPLVVGGYVDSITQLLTLLPQAVLRDYAGSFAADPHSLTLAGARDLAAPVVSSWAERRECQLVQAVTTARPGVPATIGLEDCLTAVNAGTVGLLLIADEPLVPGFHCERCDVLSVGSNECCDWGAASWPVPDLLEEMAWRTLRDGGQVVSARTLPCTAAARMQ